MRPGILAALLILMTSAAAFGLPLADAVPRPLDVLPMFEDPPCREDALICYHTGASYYIKVPSAAHGNPGPYYQRITPGASGHLNGFQFRFYNQFAGNQHHAGIVTFSVHRRVEGVPGEPELSMVVDADTLGNGILDLSVSAEFQFAEGEEFFLSLDFQPASSLDTMALVTADIGQYTGHSFFYLNQQTVWWGDQEGNLFGDMHYCADVWLNDEQPFVHFPWTRLDFGLLPAGEILQVNLPLTNQGTAPLIVHELAIDHGAWSVEAVGPDSLDPADTLMVAIQWIPSESDCIDESLLTIASNAVNAPVIEIPLRAGSSEAEILIRNWDEWQIESIQFADTGSVTNNWNVYHGLGRPEPFTGHGPAMAADSVADVLAFRNLAMPRGSWLQFRWTQLQRLHEEVQLHALVWHDNQSGFWHVMTDPDLTMEPWIGPENTWYQTPWVFWGPTPDDLPLDIGLLYAGTHPADGWYVDDFELILHHALLPPQPQIRPWGNGVRMDWPPVEDADHYLVETLHDGEAVDSFWTSDTSCVRMGDLRSTRGFYRVKAFNSFEAPVRAEGSSLHSGEVSGWSGKENMSVSRARPVSSDAISAAD